MIRALATLAARTILELGLVLIIGGGLLLFVAFRLGRRLVNMDDAGLERYSGPLIRLGQACAELAAARKTRT